MAVDRGNTTQAVFSDIINLAGVEIQSLVQYWIKTAVEAKIIFIGPPPVLPLYPAGPKSGGPHSPVIAPPMEAYNVVVRLFVSFGLYEL